MKLTKHLGLLVILGAAVAFGAFACGGDSNSKDKDTNGDTNKDTNGDTGSDSDEDTGVNTDGDSDTTPKMGISVMPAVGSGFLADTDEGNVLHMQGAWYTFGCQGAVIDPLEKAEFVRNEKGICFSGTAPQVTDVDSDGDVDYDLVWGAGIGFDVCAYSADEPDTELAEKKNPMGSCPFNPDLLDTDLANYIVGVQVDFTGEVNSSPNPLRIMFNEGDNVAAAYVMVENVPGTSTTLPGKATALFEKAKVFYNTIKKPEGTIPGNIMAIQFQIPTNGDTPVDWNFCITDVRMLSQADVPPEDTDTDTGTDTDTNTAK